MDRPSTDLTSARVVSLLDADAELAAAVPESDRATARRAARGRLVVIGAGTTTVLERLAQEPEVSGFYLAEGVLVREVALARATLPELFGPGDVLGPHGRPEGLLPAEVRLTAIEPARVVVLDAACAAAAGRWPVLLSAIERRKAVQRDRAAVLGAIGHLPRVDVRLLSVLWHLAESWGRVTAEGTVFPFPLTHEMLGRFVGSQRPTVSLALAELAERALVERREDGSWLLPPGSADALLEMLDLERTPPALVRARVARHASRAAAERSVGVRETAATQAESSTALQAEADQIRRRRA